MKSLLALAVLLLSNFVPAQKPAVQPSKEPEVAGITQAFASAWEKADAQAVALLFADEGDLVIPSGQVISGRAAIQGFYQAAFDHGYKGSRSGSEIRTTRVAGNIAVVDGKWSIQGARDVSGGPRAAEHGLFTAILEKRRDKWYIMALREMVPQE